MRGHYTTGLVISSLQVITPNKTLILLEAPAAAVVEVLEAWAQAADTTDQQINVFLARVAILGSPAGTSVSITKMDPGDQASGCTALANLTTEPTAYDSVEEDDQGAPSRSGYLYTASPGWGAFVAPGGAIGMVAASIPTSGKFVVGLRWREIG